MLSCPGVLQFFVNFKTFSSLSKIIETGYTWTDYKTNTQFANELEITPILDKLPEYKVNWIQLVNRMPHNALPRVMKHYSQTGRRNHGIPLKRLLDT
jgi:triacylglycerol esterase/lipase EstA (alpha/beta hydrolase family)